MAFVEIVNQNGILGAWPRGQLKRTWSAALVADLQAAWQAQLERKYQDFAVTMVRENAALAGHGRRLAAELKETREALWEEELQRLLTRLGRTTAELERARKSASWKVAHAAALKARITATNRWLGEHLHLGGLHEASRQTCAWQRQPDPAIAKKLGLATNYKA